MAKKTTLSFTAEELEILKSALNNYSLEMINLSKTWGVDTAFGREDYYHRFAYRVNNLWGRCYDASKRLEKRETATTTAE